MKNFITKSESAQFFECEYSCDNALFLQIGGEKHFVTDGRYQEEAQQLLKNTQLHITHDLLETVSSILQDYTRNIQKPLEIVCDPAELSHYEFVQLFLSEKNKKIEALQDKKFHQKKRICKTSKEIKAIEKSQRLNLKAFTRFADYLKSKGMGKDERRLHFQARCFLERKGKFELSFNPIVGINANAAKPHAIASSETFLKNGDLLLFDAGIQWSRYCSDCTRTGYFYEESFHFHKQQTFKNKEMQKIYDLVLKAQENAIAKVRSGMRACEVDALTREVIASGGYGDYFVHATGHGIGLDIHELPIISARSDTVIEDGMVFSIEPGIYLPQSFGVRIEDLVVMENGRARVLGNDLNG